MTSYTTIRRQRAKVHPVQVTFAFGRELTGPMDLSVAQIEGMRARREITADVRCLTCGERVVDCPTIGPWLVEPGTWPSAFDDAAV